MEDKELAKKLTYELVQSQLSRKVSETGSALSMRVGIPENSPLQIAEQVRKIREGILTNKNIDVKKAIQKEEDAIKSAIKPVDENDFKDFINEIKC